MSHLSGMDFLSKDQLSDLSHNVAHDLKSPLRKIRQFSELLALDYSDVLKGEGELYLEALTESSNELGGLIDSLLQYVRCLTDTREFETVDLNAVLTKVASDIQFNSKSDVTIVHRDLPAVKANPDLTLALFSNLLSNAVRFVGPDVQPSIEIYATEDHGSPIVYIEDNGIGISGTGAQKIFDPLVRLHSKNEFQGFGMGLALCKAICDLHGWRIGHFDNKIGGTTFEIKFSQVV